LSETEVVSLTINATEVRSIADVASIIANTIHSFADKYGVGSQHDRERTEQDLIYFLVKRNVVSLERLEVHILEDGEIGMGSFSGRRLATLLFNIRYGGGRGYL